MLGVILSAALASAVQSGDEMSRNVLVDVCLPFVAGEAAEGPLGFLGFVGPAQPEIVDDGERRDLKTEDENHLLRLTQSSGEESGDQRRTCVLQNRVADLASVRAAVSGPLQQRGFVAEADAPADRPIWSRAGVTITLRQPANSATILRVSYSSLDAEGG